MKRGEAILQLTFPPRATTKTPIDEMKICLSIAVALIVTSCHRPAEAPAQSWMCQSSEVCVTASADQEKLALQVVNKSANEVYLPALHGVGNSSSAARFEIEPTDYERSLSSGPDGIPLGAAASSVLLMPDAWMGISLSLTDIKRIYELRPGCQDLSISYVVNTIGDDQLYRGSVSATNVRLCIPAD